MLLSKTATDAESFKSILTAKGLKATPQRIAIHEAMLQLGHASADMVCEWLSTHSAVKVTTASVYNNLSQLALKGVYGFRLSASNRMFFDVITAKHLHLYDIRNHEFKDVYDEELQDAVESHLKKRHFRGYKVDGIDIQIICHPSSPKKRKD